MPAFPQKKRETTCSLELQEMPIARNLLRTDAADSPLSPATLGLENRHSHQTRMEAPSGDILIIPAPNHPGENDTESYFLPLTPPPEPLARPTGHKAFQSLSAAVQPFPKHRLAPLPPLTVNVEMGAAGAYPSPSDDAISVQEVPRRNIHSLPASPGPDSVRDSVARKTRKKSPRGLGAKKPALACFFCRGRKIACSPSVSTGTKKVCK